MRLQPRYRPHFTTALAVAIILAGCASYHEARLSLVSPYSLASAIRGARSVSLTVYMLSPYSAVTKALAADGARATVLLDGYSFGAARRDARAAARFLRQSGVSVLWSRSYWHLKSALVGQALYLDTENFGTHGFLVRDRASDDLALVRAALHGALGCDARLCTGKWLALQQEAAVIAAGHGPLDVQTESFGGNTPVLRAMIARARAGDRVTLAVNANEARGSASQWAIALAERAHIRVIGVQGTEKMAVQSGEAWFGSANLTDALHRQADLGVVTRSPSIIANLHAAFGH